MVLLVGGVTVRPGPLLLLLPRLEARGLAGSWV